VRKRKAHKELSKGNKVKILVAFKGREKESMIPIARNLVDQIFEHVEEVATYENTPTIQGRFLACTLMPKESKGAKASR
jgi:translation initiation factor IF-3